ncbi:MAG: dienelactone hydrolase family protein [Planctomycetia bacterium]|nr:dienelactone hydrolase family protein [Planctomycetia bacterium]
MFAPRVVWIALLLHCMAGNTAPAVEPLPGTAPLELEGDIASQLVDGVDRFLLRKIEEATPPGLQPRRAGPPRLRMRGPAPQPGNVMEAKRARLEHILGIRDDRLPFDAFELRVTTRDGSLIGKGTNYEIHAIRWPVLGVPGPDWFDEPLVYGEGLLLIPDQGRKPIADAVVIPDADETPEQVVGLVEGSPREQQIARGLAQLGMRVIVPTLISRHERQRRNRAKLSDREYLHRAAFELGRTLPGYEVQKVLACVDCFDHEASGKEKIAVIGYGEGGMIALYAAALDSRIELTVSGYIDDRRNIWKQPVDRNIFGLLPEFSDAGLLGMVAQGQRFVEVGGGPIVTLAGSGGAAAELRGTDRESALKVLDAAGIGRAPLVSLDAMRPKQDDPLPAIAGPLPDNDARQERQIAEIDRHNQWLLRESEHVRKEFMNQLDTSSLEKYEASVEPYRAIFANEVIGRFDDPLLPANPRSRKTYDKEKWTGYEVVLDVFPDVIAYGVLLVPKDLKEGERRPVVVCQHGLEGRPKHVIEGDEGAYHDFAAKLCERGFVVFAPQNLYIFEDRFRTLQRKANPLGKTLFSIMVPQHQQITDWLKTLPFVDGERIGFYGLSYGGKSAMRIPALVKNYCLSICSADFNEWVWKNASTRSEYSYVWSGEYEIFEWDLGSTFNYAEMAALIAPRPFMVERGHFDGVAPDEAVAYEYAKVRHLYAAKLGIGDRTEIEFFVGPHTINGQGTFDFLHRHLNWPKPGE